MSSFSSPVDVLPVTKALSSTINNLDAAVATAFALLPTEANLTRGTVNYAVDTGVVNAYVVALPHVPSGYIDGLMVRFRALNTNTAAATINVNAMGVKSIKDFAGAALSAEDIVVGVPMELIYSTTTGFFHLLGATVGQLTAKVALAAAQVALATTQVSLATTQASTATTQASNASASAISAAASYDSFDDRYLGSKAADPTFDNDGNALLTGALYWNSVASEMRVYTVATWVATYLPSSAYMLQVAPGTSGNVLTSNGAAWVSSPSSTAGSAIYTALNFGGF